MILEEPRHKYQGRWTDVPSCVQLEVYNNAVTNFSNSIAGNG